MIKIIKTIFIHWNKAEIKYSYNEKWNLENVA